jgi:hypothetical protein
VLIAHGGTLCPIELATVASLLAVYLSRLISSMRRGNSRFFHSSYSCN